MDITLVLGIAVIFCGATIAAVAGFGFSLVVVPPLLLLYDPPTVTAMVLVMTIATRWVVLLEIWRETRWRTVGEMLPTALIGLAAGALIVTEVDAALIKLLAGSLVMVTAMLLLRGWRFKRAGSPWAPPVAGLTSGVLNTTTGMDGPPVVLLLMSRDYATQSFRATITIYYYVISPIGLMILIERGLVGWHEARLAAAAVPVVAIGVVLGNWLVRRVSPAAFRRMVLVLLLLTGAVGIMAALIDFAA
jgi:uncharacterized protein